MRLPRMLPFAALLIVASAVTASTLNKCCPAGQSLHPDLKSCVPSKNAGSQFQNNTLVFVNSTTGGQFNIKCPVEESDALVWDSADMNFTVNVDTLELVPDRLNGVDKFNVDEFCLDQVNSDWIAFTCPCIKGVCVRTCCPRGQLLKLDGPEKKYECVNATGNWRDWSPLKFTEPRASGYFLLEEIPKCSAHGDIFAIHMEEFNISANGVTTYSSYDDNGDLEVLNHTLDSKNCLGIESIHDNSTDEVEIKKVIFECIPPQEQPDALRTAIYTILFVIGAIFLLATIVVHLALPVLTKGVRGKGLVAHCAFMFVAHIALIVVQLKGSTLDNEPCHILAYLIQYTLLAGFFWLNVLCINISMTFRSLQSMVPRGMLSERKQFAWYTVYALAIPFAIFIATLTTNQVYAHYGNKEVNLFLPNPGIGVESCWFSKDSKSILVFFYGPIGILLLINLILFVFTTYKIYKLSHASNMINQNDNSQRHNSEHKRFLLFLKLFGLMGIPWVFEIISWGVGGRDVYWYFTDAVNILRSIFIFTTFCWKKKVWRLLCEKYPKIKKFALMIRTEPSAAELSRSNPSNNESYAETMNAVSMETVALDVPNGKPEPVTII